MTIDEDYAAERLRQKRLDQLTDSEFIALMNLPKPTQDADDMVLRELENQNARTI